MKLAIENIAFGLFGLYAILLPAILIMKIKDYKISRRKAYTGIAELFSFLSSEWWIEGITLWFPIFGRDVNAELNTIRKKANTRLYILYSTVATQVALVGLLEKL